MELLTRRHVVWITFLCVAAVMTLLSEAAFRIIKLNLRNTDLRNARLTGRNLRSADIRGANLQGADLQDADLQDVNLASSDLTNARLTSADLTRANLFDTKLVGADLRRVYFNAALLDKADMRRADLSGATALTSAQLEAALIDEGTILPDYMRRSGGQYAGTANLESSGSLPAISMKPKIEIPLQYLPYKVALSSDGMTVASVGDIEDIKLWHVEADGSVQERTSLTGHTGNGRSVAISPSDDQTIASGSDDGTIRLWRASDSAPLKTLNGPGDEGYVFNLKFDKSGRTLVSASRKVPGNEKTVHVWDVESGTSTSSIKVGPAETIVDLNADQKLMAIIPSGGRAVEIRSITDNRSVRQLTNVKGDVTSGAFSDDGQLLAIGSLNRKRGEILVWRVDDGQRVGEPLTASGGSASSIAFSPFRSLLVAGWTNGSVNLWSLYDSRLIYSFSEHNGKDVSGLAFNSNGRIFASAGADKIIKLWQVE